MIRKLPTNVTYALAFGGGGAKGAYQIGAWRALREAGVQVTAVSGTSVGALNGALVAMDELEKAEEIWKNIRFSQVMDVDDQAMARLIRGDLRPTDLQSAAGQLRDVVQKRGFDVTPLYSWMRDVVDEEKIRASDRELFIVTWSLSDRKELELRAKDLEPGTIPNMLLASAYLPVFRNEKLGGKRYTDGGVRDVLPIHVLVEHGYRNIIALRLFGFGIERHTRIPEDTHVYYISPTVDLGGTLGFLPEQSELGLKAGYFDAQRLLYGLAGKRWYIDAQWDEEQAYRYLMRHIRAWFHAEGRGESLREIHEDCLPRMCRKLDAADGDYRELLYVMLEAAAEELGLDRWKIYTEVSLVEAIAAAAHGKFVPEAVEDSLAPKMRLFRER